MRVEAGPVSRAIARRRSVRTFSDRPVAAEVVRQLVELACCAPAPHHSRPWRFANVSTRDSRIALSDAMMDAWRADLETDGRTVHEIDRLIRRSQSQITGAPVLLLACLALNQSREWPDHERQRAERDMFVQSLGAALQNVLLAAEEFGLAGYLKGAPLFCVEAVREAMDLPPEWEPAFLVLLGYPEDAARPEVRAAVEAGDFMLER